MDIDRYRYRYRLDIDIDIDIHKLDSRYTDIYKLYTSI